MGKSVDITVIGGGIQGASVAEAAAADGYRVLLLERRHPAYGTSSRSSKLIHGGLRYLETGQLRLVRECLHERTILLRRAPRLVHLQDFLIPVFRRTRRRPWQIGSGLSLYALLAAFGPGSGFSTLPQRRWQELDGLDTQQLQCVFRYHDGQTDDAALTRAVLGSARRLGANIRYPAEFEGATRTDDGWQLSFVADGQRQTLASRTLVNAGGPWVNRIVERIDRSHPPMAIELIQGTHVVVEGSPRTAFYTEADDGRAVFVLPWQGNTLIGTTETAFDGEPDRVAPQDAEIDYLLRTFHSYFPGRRQDRLLEAFAGLRVLPQASERPFARPRETLLAVDNRHHPSLVSIYGGKLTAARATAMRVLQQLRAALPNSITVADTRELSLSPVKPDDPVAKPL